MKSIKSFLKILALSVICFGSQVEAKGGGGFSSSSRSFSSSSSSSSRPSSSSWGSSSKSYTAPKASPPSSSATKYTGPSSNSYSKPSTASPQTSSRPTSRADVARYESASKSGKVFSTRESAVADFKAKNATTYTSRYSVEPSSRPSYIPQSYNYGGRRVDVTFNANYGGYGYWSGGNMGVGQFLLYDALSDAAMTNTLMSRQNYYVGAAPVYHGFSYWFGITVAIFIVVLVLAAIVKRVD